MGKIFYFELSMKDFIIACHPENLATIYKLSQINY